MATVTTTTVTPAAPVSYAAAPAISQPVAYAQQPAHAHPVHCAHVPAPAPGNAYAPGPAPVVASSYTAGTSLPHHEHLNTSVHTSAHQVDGYHTVLGDIYAARGEYDLYLNALNASTPILDEARSHLNLPVGWDISKNELGPLQLIKKHWLKEFKREIIRLVDEQRAARLVAQPRAGHAVSNIVPITSVPAAPLPQLI